MHIVIPSTGTPNAYEVRRIQGDRPRVVIGPDGEGRLDVEEGDLVAVLGTGDRGELFVTIVNRGRPTANVSVGIDGQRDRIALYDDRERTRTEAHLREDGSPVIKTYDNYGRKDTVMFIGGFESEE
jgi:hypothetical protein